jgi:transposase-like protein
MAHGAPSAGQQETAAMPSHINNPIFHDEAKAREWFEARIWPDGPFCPHCGETQKLTRLHGKAHRPGLIQCNSCREQFTVTVNTVCERSKIPLTKWCLAIYLLNSSKKGMSALQMHRMMGGSYKTAWFMMHRIREAMRVGGLTPMGGNGGVVEIDETYIGRKDGFEVKRGFGHKNAIFTLVERGGSARSFHVEDATKDTILPIFAPIWTASRTS